MDQMATMPPPRQRVLLADDDEDDRNLFQTALKEINENIKCDFATDGKEALSILKKNDILPEILFLDLNMPKVNGFECLRKLKNDIQLAQLPVVIFTILMRALRP